MIHTYFMFRLNTISLKFANPASKFSIIFSANTSGSVNYHFKSDLIQKHIHN